jgi:hypothetical protein
LQNFAKRLYKRNAYISQERILPVSDQENELVIVQLRMPASDYEAIRQAAKASFRSANKEVLFRLRQSLIADGAARQPATAEA